MLVAVLNHLVRDQHSVTNTGQAVDVVEPPPFLPVNGQNLQTTLIGGSNSIMKTLPVPQMKLIDNGYVYVPLIETLKWQFGSDNPPNMFHPWGGSVHASSHRGQELLADFIFSDTTGKGPSLYPVKLVLWSDGFESFNVTINSEATAHACFATIGAEDGEDQVIEIDDVSRAFFEAPAVRQVCVEIPEEALTPEDKDQDMVGHLMMSLYGTRDAATN